MGDFVMALIDTSKSEVLFDDYLLDSLIAWLTAMSSSGYRAFRHTATFAGK